MTWARVSERGRWHAIKDASGKVGQAVCGRIVRIAEQTDLPDPAESCEKCTSELEQR